jgi:hypothetical protein
MQFRDLANYAQEYPWTERRHRALDLMNDERGMAPEVAITAWVGYLEDEFTNVLDGACTITGSNADEREERLIALSALEPILTEIDLAQGELELLAQDRAGVL